MYYVRSSECGRWEVWYDFTDGRSTKVAEYLDPHQAWEEAEQLNDVKEPEACDESEWQSIYTAPREPLHGELRIGPRILVWVNGEVGIAEWDEDWKNFYVLYPPHHDKIQPTHWKPYPKAPTYPDGE